MDMEVCHSSLEASSFDPDTSSLSGRLSARDIRAGSPLDMPEKEQTMQAEIDGLKDRVLQLQERVKHAESLSAQAKADKSSAERTNIITEATCNGAVRAKNEMWHKLQHESSSRQAISLQLASSQEEVGILRGRLSQALSNLEQERAESQKSKANVEALTERVDNLKDQLLETERALVKKDEELHAAAGDRDSTDAIKAHCKQEVTREQALRHWAELQMQEAINEATTYSKDKQLAELQSEDARRMLDLEVKLRTQLAHEKDEVVQQLLEEQSAAAQLERRLGEAEVALSAAAEELVTLRNLNVGSGRDRDESVQAMMTQLHDRVCQAESGRKVAEAEWYNVDKMRLDAIDARTEAENNWQQVSLILEKEQEGKKEVLQELLAERTARQLAQKTLAHIAASEPPLTARTSCNVQAALIRDANEEGRGLACVRTALGDVKQSQIGVLEQVQELQNALGLLSFTSSSQAQGVEAARAKAEHASRMALLVVQQAESMLTAVVKHNQLTIASAPTRGSSEGAEDDNQWEEDSIFADGFQGLLDDMSQNSAEAFSDPGVCVRSRGSLNGESSDDSITSAAGRPCSERSASPAALLRPLSRVPVLEGAASDKARGDGTPPKAAELIASTDENSPLLGNQGDLTGGLQRPISVPRLVLKERRSHRDQVVQGSVRDGIRTLQGDDF